MYDGGIQDKSAALSDLFNQAAKTGMVCNQAGWDELQLHSRLMNFYLDKVDVYQCQYSSSIRDGIDYIAEGLEIGGDIDDAMTDIFKFGNTWDIKQAVHQEIDLWNGDKTAMQVHEFMGDL